MYAEDQERLLCGGELHGAGLSLQSEAYWVMVTVIPVTATAQ